VRDQLNVYSMVEIQSAELFNELGQQVVAQAVHQKMFSMETTAMKEGIYFLQLTTSSGLIRKKICVMK